MYKERIEQVQKYLKAKNKDAYLAFISDDHGSEYILSTYKSLAFLCGFTGSNGILLVTKKESFLWTDGRYFLQAASQLKEAGTKLMKMGIDMSILDYIKENIKSIMLDFKVTRVSFVDALKKVKKNVRLYDEPNLVDTMWENRPALPEDEIFLLPETSYKLSAKEKIAKTLKATKNKNATVLVSALDDIAWLLNARGLDIPCNPVFLSFLLIDANQTVLYINEKKVNEEVKAKLTTQGITLKPYNDVYEDVSKINSVIYFDSNKTNYQLFTLMKKKRNVMLWSTKAKSIKTSIDIKDSKAAHVKDGVAMCKFMYYLKTNVGKIPMDELSVSDYLANLRYQQGAFELSFGTICGYKEHGAIIHYGATKETNKVIENDGFLLVDSGGQYYYGTTDITRTFALNNITDEMKYHFTLVLKAHIDLAKAIFDKTVTDAELDKICRKPIWDANLDYNHGTGHGVGHMLNVHEGPQSISHYKAKPAPMEKGMITSDEPGLYFEGKYGIRHENEILCVGKGKDKLGFETITYVPFDLDGINVSMLDESEKEWLNNYHALVYKKVAKYLTSKEKAFLRNATRKV